MTKNYAGQCLCGAVSLSVEGEVSEAVACHCDQCRQWSGHFWSSVNCDIADLTIKDPEEQLTWYQSSDKARRGHCARCGSSLFFQDIKNGAFAEMMSISGGVLQGLAGINTKKHIYCAEKGSYYALPDNEVQKAIR